jgi:protein tyrosine phosphatase (PTP) superfamily phosphohydrolase (DUF442 family)
MMDISKISDGIWIGTTPSQRDYDRLRDLGVKLVINMRACWGNPPAGQHPAIRYLRLRTFDSPLVPIPASALVRGTQAALEVMNAGGGIYTHCSRGRHRSVAMAAAILIAKGWSPEDAMRLIKERRPEADPEAPHIRPRILAFERIWKEQSTVHPQGLH